VAPDEPRHLVDALIAVDRGLAAARVPYMIIGGIAVMARGLVRMTDDIDLVVASDSAPPERLVDLLASEQIEPRRDDAVAFAHVQQVLLLRHAPTRTAIDLSLGWLPFEAEALARAERVAFGDAQIAVATAEDLVIYKAVAWRDRDRDDLEHLVRLHAHSLDLDRVRAVIAEFATALDDADRPAALDRLIAHAMRASRRARSER
jgi:hypothetical protein